MRSFGAGFFGCFGVGVALLVAAVVVVALGAGGSTRVGETGAAATPAPGLEPVGEPVVKKGISGSVSADGRVRNTDSQPRTGFVKVTLFDGEGKVVGVANGAVNRVGPGEEVTYSAISADRPEAWARAEVRVDSQFRARD